VWTDDVWLTPNLMSPDMRNLFTEPHLWPNARSRVKVFKFYHQQLLHETDESCQHTCGNNTWGELNAVHAIELLTEWGIRIAMEGAAEHSCINSDIIAGNALAIEHVHSAGGRLDYIAMDEPATNGGTACPGGKTNLEWALEYMAAMKAAEPNVIIGDIEPFPFLSVDQIIGFMDGLEAGGHKLAFFHLDANLHDPAFTMAGVQAIQQACAQRGIAFGPIITSNETSSNYAYYADAIAWLHQFAPVLGRPDHVLFQSFAGPPGNQVMPVNLPELPASEDAEIIYSHTRLVIQGTNELPGE